MQADGRKGQVKRGSLGQEETPVATRRRWRRRAGMRGRVEVAPTMGVACTMAAKRRRVRARAGTRECHHRLHLLPMDGSKL